ncbi:glycosyltransferase [Pinisolibacter aquiterrae]|uniref:glycosyltransferase n=1 Tax=Pinisolibacter aquiterrae TaxID=2815579 RepID=UPI001C3DD943|nr:glycosyltransferase [Pinisolibacter aquiterrae]MBV5265665.1 glycosyltransferase [Pinisolibacter aquiterrae]MCC8236770.1 glycosyltransferase [Pinisolibacter aquiterrae]
MLGAPGETTLVMAPPPDRRGAVADFLRLNPGERPRLAVATPREIRRALIERWAPALTRRAVRAVLDRDPGQSAASAPAPGQLLALGVAVAVWGLALWGAVSPIVMAWTCAFLMIGLFRMLVADARPPVAPSPVDDADLPRYAVLVPVFREVEVIAPLVAALSALDYPPDRLEIRLVVEADDGPTRAAAEAATLDTPLDIVVVPPSLPRTKPKALNFALATVDAEFVTVYDAEDRPDPDQLRLAVAAFRAGPPELAVVQAALVIDHDARARPWLVRQFEIEYAMLFRGLLPWLAERRLFLPLGGTSNHFRRSVLDVIGGWDPHNVTEDADIAVRIVRAGWHAGVVASATREEAPIDLRAWLAQRTRWMKGWMQTWLAHMRSPLRLHRELGLAGALAFHLVFAGQLLSAITFAPSLLLLSLQIGGFVPLFVGETIDGDVVALSALVAFSSGLLGAFILAMKVSERSPRRFRLADVLSMPLYWCAVSLATYTAAIELIHAPSRWNKTRHGRAVREGDARPPCTTPPGEGMRKHARAGVVQR